MADSRKAALARVVGAKVHVSLASSTIEEVARNSRRGSRATARDASGRVPAIAEPRRRPGRRPRRRDPVLRGGIRPRAHPRSVVRLAGRLAPGGIAPAPSHASSRARPGPGHFALEVDDFGAVYRWAVGPACSRSSRRRAVSSCRAASTRCASHDPDGNVSGLTRDARGGGSGFLSWFARRITIPRAPVRTGRRFARRDRLYVGLEHRRLQPVGCPDAGVAASPGWRHGDRGSLGTGSKEPVGSGLAVPGLEGEAEVPDTRPASLDLVDVGASGFVEELRAAVRRRAGPRGRRRCSSRRSGCARARRGRTRAPRRSRARSAPLSARSLRSDSLKRPGDEPLMALSVVTATIGSSSPSDR